MNGIYKWLNPLALCAIIGLTGCSDQDYDLFLYGESFPPRAYTKLDATGNPLADQGKAWNVDDATASEANSDRWSCVKDDATGLVFEIKTHDGGLRDYMHRYTWYSSDAATNAGDHGIGDLGAGLTTHYQTPDPDVPYQPIAGSDDCFDPARCDTEKFVADVNAAGLCGHNDWRLPTKNELALLRTGTSGYSSIIAAGMLPPDQLSDNYIDSDYFPEHSQINFVLADFDNVFWTSSPHYNEPFDMMNYDAHWASVVSFFGGGLWQELKEDAYFVRLVRAGG